MPDTPIADTLPSPMTDPAARGNTRARILDASRALFNARGPGAVTTAEIAAASGISEGNLHYHFRRKEQIVDALFGGYEAALDQTIAQRRITPGGAETPGLNLQPFFALMWEWRFVYGGSLLRVAPGVGPRLTRLTDHGQADIRRVLVGLTEAGLLRATPAELDKLVVNAWIVASYWIDYLQSRQGVSEITRAHLDWGLAQVEALFAPYQPAS